MVACVHTGTLAGIESVHVAVEADLVRRLPRVAVVGLAADAVRESTERVRSAIVSSGLEFPKLRVTINLAPADLRKTGTGFDLPIAVAVLAASGQVPADSLSRMSCVGELSLDGRLRGVPGALPHAILARRLELQEIILPESCAAEAAPLTGIEVLSASSLLQVVEHLRGARALPRAVATNEAPLSRAADLSEVRGQTMAKRALEVAAAGGHSLLMVGPPGVGKTMYLCRGAPPVPASLDVEGR
ncbi:MAG: ATP-binding protein [Polyangiaceae bacterium]|nr:ATP-binding protein [Polyangiaceae bacterium]